MHILITNPFGIGDVIFSLPMVYALKKYYPESKIDYICNKRVADILRAQEDIDRVYIYEKDDWRSKFKKSKIEAFREFSSFIKDIKRERYDLVFDLSLSKEFGFMLWFLGIKLRIGYNYKNRGIFLNKNIELDGYSSKHVVEHHLELLSLLGIDNSYSKKRLSVPKEHIERANNKIKNINRDHALIAVVPGGGASWGRDAYKKRWADENYSKLVSLIARDSKVSILLLGDRIDSSNFSISIDSDNIYDYMGKTDMLEFMALISRVDMVITNDGGPLHIAVALDIPTISIFGPVSENVYGPYPKDLKHRVVTSDLSCRPCYNKFKVPKCDDYRCLNNINVDYLFNEFKKHVKLLGLEYEDKVS